MRNLDKSLQWTSTECSDVNRLTGNVELSQPYIFG